MKKEKSLWFNRCLKISRIPTMFIAISLLFVMFTINGCAHGLKGRVVTPEKKPAAKAAKILPYEKVITDKARSDTGLFTVHFVDEKLYFEIANEMLDVEMLLVSRLARAATKSGYGGQKMNTQVLRWQRLKEKILLRIVSHVNVADEGKPIYEAVRNANFEPIVAAFDIKAFGKDNATVVIEVTDLFTNDIPMLGLSRRRRDYYKVRSLDKDRSFIVWAKSFPRNIETRNILTYSASEPPDNTSTGTISVEMNHSMILLPEKPMMPRQWDERLGFYRIEQTDYGLDTQRAEKRRYITRWRLEPKNPQAFAAGKLVEPVKPIVYYIDPATPLKWRPYIKQGVEDWKVAFEAAGFKNAIMAKDPPSPQEDPEFSPEDVRYSVIRYFPSEVMNAMGPHVHDPRSGEILESDIYLYHNVLNIVRNWYFIQTAAVNPEARGVTFEDEVMGRLLRYVVAHEVGHTLGFPHNMKASSTIPVEKLRSPAFTQKMGTTPSIMDYARFNYVAQPGDGVKHFVPIIGPYDVYAVRWGYRPIPEAKTAEAEKPILSQWIKEKVGDPFYHFEGSSRFDPTTASEALGDDAVTASEYGIANLKRVLNKLLDWTYQEDEDYSQLKELYEGIIGQWSRYMGHVVAYIGGVYQHHKTFDQPGPVYTVVPEEKQRQAMAFLTRQAFPTPIWMINREVLDRIEHSGIVARIRQAQARVIQNLLDPARLQRLIEAEARPGHRAYTLRRMLLDLKAAVFSEIKKGGAINTYRRNLQRAYIEQVASLLKPEPKPKPTTTRRTRPVTTTIIKVSQSDIQPLLRGELEALKQDIEKSIDQINDTVTVLHLKDLLARIDNILDPEDTT